MLWHKTGLVCMVHSNITKNCATVFYQNQYALVGTHGVIKLDLTGLRQEQ